MKWLYVYPCMNTIEENELVGYLHDSREHEAGAHCLAIIPVAENVVTDSTGITILIETEAPQHPTWKREIS